MSSIRIRTLCAVLFMTVTGGMARAKDYTVVITAPDRNYRNVPVCLTLDMPAEAPSAVESDWTARLRMGGRDIPAETRWREKGKLDVLWILPEIRKGQRQTGRLTLSTTSALNGPKPVIELKLQEKNLDILINDQLFTRYDTTTGPNKPYFYPLYGPDEKLLVRHYPLEKVTGETNDHPHHRGLWFTHGAVNGEDYWTEGGKTASTVHRAYDAIRSGRACGYFRATTDWINREGKKVAEDVRDVTVWNVPEGRLMDFTVTLKATDGPIELGDTKEGSFGLRLPDSMRVAGGDGHIETSTGLKDAAAWGKRAAWVDYYGTVDGETVGIAILDDPKNLRHPTYWHVRDYGLFAVNPFGLHDFEKGQPAGAGNVTIPAGGALTFRYRLFFHKGSTSDARIADLWTAYADPPKVEIH